MATDPFDAFADALVSRIMEKIDQRLAGMVPDSPATLNPPPDVVVPEEAELGDHPPVLPFPRPNEVREAFNRPAQQFEPTSAAPEGGSWVDAKTRRDLIGNARPPVSDMAIEKPGMGHPDMPRHMLGGAEIAARYEHEFVAPMRARPIEDGG